MAQRNESVANRREGLAMGQPENRRNGAARESTAGRRNGAAMRIGDKSSQEACAIGAKRINIMLRGPK